ncbi:hypothetical protein BGZ58_006264 [Dissophora ornata]|nr:hypothetical protein BGZ58_006264 [Dissophora ornata]
MATENPDTIAFKDDPIPQKEKSLDKTPSHHSDEQAQHPNRVYFNGEAESTFLIEPKTWKTFRDDGSFYIITNIPKRVLKRGYYSIIWCISPRHLGQVLLKGLVFEVEARFMKQKLHLRFDSQVSVRLYGDLHAPLSEQEAGSGLEGHFGVHYLELERLGSDNSRNNRDYIVEAPGRKLHLLDVRTCQQSQDVVQYAPMAQIFAMDTSASRAYVAVLSATVSAAYVGIWDIETALPASSNGLQELGRQSITSHPPMATASIPLQEGEFDNMRLVRIAISSDGSSVAIYQQPHDDDLAPDETTPENFQFPFRVFQVKTSFTVAEKLPSAVTTALIEDTTTQRSMAQFVGFGKFMAKEKIVPTGNDTLSGDYFIACNESRINLYDANNDWKPLYGIAIGGLCSMKSRMKQLRMLVQSIEGPIFVWWEDAQNVSLWDIVTGSSLKYISVNNPRSRIQHEIEYLTVSRGGRLLALGGRDWIRTFFMDSGIEICHTVVNEGQILDISFLDEDKSLLVTLSKSTMEQISVIMDALNLSFRHCAVRQFPSSTYSIQHVTQLSDRTPEHVMMAVNGNELEMFAIPQPGVFSAGGALLHCEDECATKESLKLDKRIYQVSGTNSSYRLIVDFEEREIDSRRQKLARIMLVFVDEQGSTQLVMSAIPEPWRLFDQDEENAEDYIQASFLASWPQFIIVFSKGFQVWNLPDLASDNRCELALAWVHPRTGSSSDMNDHTDQIEEVRVCMHAESVRPSWVSHKTGKSETACVRIPKSNWFTRNETLHCINSIPLLLAFYSEASVSAQDAVVRHIIKHINQEPPEGTIKDSVISKIAWTSKWQECTDILNAIFNSTDGKWVPRSTCSYTSSHWSTVSDNTIFLLVINAKKEPRSLPMAKQLIDYCIREARLQRDPGFLGLVLMCLPTLVVYYPDTAIDIVRRTAFIPVKDRDFLVNNSVMAHSPRIIIDTASSWAIKRHRRPIYEYPNAVFQLKCQLPRICAKDFSSHIEIVKEKTVDPLNETFKKQVYVAPYGLLWHTRNGPTSKQRENLIADTNYAKMVVGLITDKLNPWSRQAIRANFTDLQYFDNPAVEALLEYKWNTFACFPWALRFFCQLVYYVLVLTVTLIQVYPQIMLTDLKGPLIAIIVLGGMFLYLELQQLLADHWKYMSTAYNMVDVLVFLLPAIGSIQLLINMPEDENTDVLGNSRVLSFSILFIYTHIMFEMRVLRSVCDIVTIILSIVVKIRVFFAIFALSILAFTHAILHLLLAKNHDCLTTDANGNEISTPEACTTRDTDFPSNFVGALSATYFFMAGRYDFVDKDLGSDDWAFHIILAAFFFITVILMLNVLIALMNVAFSVGDDNSPLVWLDNRLRSVESAENLSYSTPGLRERFDWFPHYIYYTASQRAVQAYENKYPFALGDREDVQPPQRTSSPPVIVSLEQESSLQTSLPQEQLSQQSIHEVPEADTSAALIKTESTRNPVQSPWIPHSATESTVFGTPTSPSSTKSRRRTYFADARQRPQQQQQPRQRGVLRQGTGQSANFLRSKNDRDGDGTDDKFERDNVYDYGEDSAENDDDGDGAEGDEGQDSLSVQSRLNLDERQRQTQAEMKSVQESTELLRENVRGLESKLDQMTVMIELLLQQQQQQSPSQQ